MQYPASLLAIACSVVAAAFASPVSHQQQPAVQKFLSDPVHYHPPRYRKPTSSGDHRNVGPNSVGLMLTSDDEGYGYTHVWLPIGVQVYTRDAPELPLRPSTARITTMIRSSPQKAKPELLERVVCLIYPKYNISAEIPDPDMLAIELTREMDVVRLDEAAQKPWREIESYLCS
ncbi:hypothetical protein Tdes44962_MAKER00884 [Teratosphaeria destructans]|uniref:Uncharacterized protein n=1 Tax=Teratosphaeria destructans TaxID=418781 RepID=A0A9W7SKX7_9PEZI|nr:hypothetical protein Tdes44962_MAKER00884 [Teratosphaeria destructans]